MMHDDVDFDLRGFIENSLLEWENHVAAVVIAGGCNLRCPYCHSWRYVTGLDELQRLDLDCVFNLLDRQRGWIDGVVFTGGEPTLQPGLQAMIRRCRDYEVRIKLHTNGTRPDTVKALLDENLLDCLAVDYKAPLDNRFFAAAGIQAGEKTLAAVTETFALAKRYGIDREYHSTLNPAFISPEALTDMAEQLDRDGLWILQQYEPDDCLNPAAAGKNRYSGAELDALEETARRLHPQVQLKRGTSA